MWCMVGGGQHMGVKDEWPRLDKDLWAQLMVRTLSCLCLLCSRPRWVDLYKSSQAEAQQLISIRQTHIYFYRKETQADWKKLEHKVQSFLPHEPNCPRHINIYTLEDSPSLLGWRRSLKVGFVFFVYASNPFISSLSDIKSTKNVSSAQCNLPETVEAFGKNFNCCRGNIN